MYWKIVWTMPTPAARRCDGATLAKLAGMDPNAREPLVVLHDGAAGNRRQALALACALKIPCRELPLEPRAPWRWLAPRALPGARRAFGRAFEATLAAPPLLAIGCGRQAALATRLLRDAGSRVVQILDPRLATKHWDRVVVPEHDALRGDGVLTLRGSLNPVDEAWLAAARAAAPAWGEAPGPRTALFVGGPTAACGWSAAALAAAVDLLLAAHAHDGGTLWVSGSRRTPAALRRQLRQQLEGRATLWLDDADGPNPWAAWLAWADRLVVTPDSANLLSEAASTAAPVWVAFPDYAGGRVRALMDAALSCGRARPLSLELRPWPVTPWAETAGVAAALGKWLAHAGSGASSAIRSSSVSSDAARRPPP